MMFKSLSFSLKVELKEANSLPSGNYYNIQEIQTVFFFFFQSQKQSISPKDNYSVPTSNPQ